MSDEFAGNITIMTITYQESIFARRFVSSQRFKTLSQPLYSMLITCPTFCIASKTPLSRNISVNPSYWKFCPFENDQRWKSLSVRANAFHRCNPFLTSRFALKLLPNIDVDNTFGCLNFSDRIAAFIYVVFIFRKDFVFRNCQEWDHGLLRKIYNELSDFVN